MACFKKAAGGWVKLPQLLQIVAHETRHEGDDKSRLRIYPRVLTITNTEIGDGR